MANLVLSKQLWLWGHLHSFHLEAKSPWKWMIMFQPGACHHAPFILHGGGKAINYSINQKLCWLRRGCKVHSYRVVHFVFVLAKLGSLWLLYSVYTYSAVCEYYVGLAVKWLSYGNTRGYILYVCTFNREPGGQGRRNMTQCVYVDTCACRTRTEWWNHSYHIIFSLCWRHHSFC